MVKTWVMLTLAVWLSLLAVAEAPADNNILVPPPAIYDHVPAIPVLRRYVDTTRLCPTRSGMAVLGCSVVLRGKCWMLLTGASLSPGIRRLLIRHENARCNGYRG